MSKLIARKYRTQTIEQAREMVGGYGPQPAFVSALIEPDDTGFHVTLHLQVRDGLDERKP